MSDFGSGGPETKPCGASQIPEHNTDRKERKEGRKKETNANANNRLNTSPVSLQ